MSNKTEIQSLLPERISPEGLAIAECYLTHGQDALEVAVKLNMPVEEVRRYLATQEVRSFVTETFNEIGFRNKGRMFATMDEIVNRKLKELEESDQTSDLDIMVILEKYHKMQIEYLKLEQARFDQQDKIQNQTNVQINGGGGSNFDKLLSRLIR